MSAVLPTGAKPASTLRVAPARADDAEEKRPDVGSAIERLALSRERLREAMMPSAKTKTPGHGLGAGIGSMASRLADRVRATPGAGVVLDGVQAWWAQHPLHGVGRVAAEASRKLAAPVAERNPLLLVFGAVAIGALLALFRPWRLLLRPALFAGLLPAVAATAMREVPLETLLNLLGLGRPRAGPAPAAATAPPAAEPSPVASMSNVGVASATKHGADSAWRDPSAAATRPAAVTMP
jgi:hypothetical protein